MALYSDGLVVDAASAPEHEEKRARLPLSGVQTQQLLTESQFRDQMAPVLDWSVKREPECRFFVRVFDLTGDEQKNVYKSRLRAVESRFYKLETSAHLPTGLRREAAWAADPSGFPPKEN